MENRKKNTGKKHHTWKGILAFANKAASITTSRQRKEKAFSLFGGSIYSRSDRRNRTLHPHRMDRQRIYGGSAGYWTPVVPSWLFGCRLCFAGRFTGRKYVVVSSLCLPYSRKYPNIPDRKDEPSFHGDNSKGIIGRVQKPDPG